jgi:hypothetical protein
MKKKLWQCRNQQRPKLQPLIKESLKAPQNWIFTLPEMAWCSYFIIINQIPKYEFRETFANAGFVSINNVQWGKTLLLIYTTEAQENESKKIATMRNLERTDISNIPWIGSYSETEKESKHGTKFLLEMGPDHINPILLLYDTLLKRLISYQNFTQFRSTLSYLIFSWICSVDNFVDLRYWVSDWYDILILFMIWSLMGE